MELAMSIKIDNTDKKILHQLQENSDISLQGLGEKIGLSSTPCYRRIQRLEQSGIIKKRVTRLSLRALCLNFEAFVNVKLTDRSPETIHQFEKMIAYIPEVVSCRGVEGDVDYILQVISKDSVAYIRLLQDRLMTRSLIGDIETQMIVRQSKNTWALPLEYILDSK